jgi:adenine-specific DNA methylase
MENVFPHKEDVNYTKLKMTPEGLYSITRRRDGEKMLEFIQSRIPEIQKLSITDATACIGGDTLLFSLHFKKVDSIEWKHDNITVLRNNIDAFGATNVTVYEGDSTKLFNWKTDVLYVDPPWGGPEYYKIYQLDLFIGHYRLDMWIEGILKRCNRPEYIILKLPSNYNFSRLQFLPNVYTMYTYLIRRFVVVLLATS